LQISKEIQGMLSKHMQRIIRKEKTMSKKKASLGKPMGVALGLLLTISAGNAQWSGLHEISNLYRFSLSMQGGCGFSEDSQAMADLRTELQFGLSQRIRLGLGIGYLHGSGRHGQLGNRDDWQKEMTNVQTGREIDESLNDAARFGRENREDFRLMPLSLNAYYFLPVAHKLSIFMSGGGSYYIGWFHGASSPHDKNAWGGQGGIGFEYRLTRRIGLVIESNYRFVSFGGFKRLVPVVSNPAGEGASETVTYVTQRDRMDLNGINLRAGIKFGL
jgi:hypothetical protein